jgi:hypothetical protein
MPIPLDIIIQRLALLLLVPIPLAGKRSNRFLMPIPLAITTAVGLALANTTAANTAFGYQALGANTTGANNSAFGYAALGANTTGANNSAFGTAALGANTTA